MSVTRFVSFFVFVASLIALPTVAEAETLPEGDGDDLEVVIRARGDTGDEQMTVTYGEGDPVELGVVDVDKEWALYTLVLPEDEWLESIIIEFSNEFYEPPYDRNLLVDYIEVAGVRVETEDPNTYATGGVWTAADGCTSGYRQTEKLNCPGEFVYLAPAGPDVELLVRARGVTGDERLLVTYGIDDIYVGHYDVTTEWDVYPFVLPGGTRLANIEVRFTNDYYQPPYDRNLIIDYVEYRGKRYESEAIETYSTGTWASSDGCAPGHKQRDRLSCNGSFRYAGRQPS